MSVLPPCLSSFKTVIVYDIVIVYKHCQSEARDLGVPGHGTELAEC
jgi:hypothetical protein